ncbi:MAG: radical SAM protein [Candidatus Omnitrophota bacterium]|nr:radical SAM protein [Candidatus Omnitrophota bacterium]
MFRCKMCYIWNINDDKTAESTIEENKQFVKSLRDLVEPGFEFHLSGGEPLLTNGILDLVKFISDEGHKTDLVTNGFLINKSMARDIVDSRLDTLTISLDGINKETHNFIRGVAGSYERIMRAIGYIDKFRKDKRPKISLLTIIMEHNLDEILKLVDWVQQDERIEMISFQAVTQPFGEAVDNVWFMKRENRFLWPQDTEKVAKVMETLRELRLNGYKIGNQPNHFLHFREYFKDPNRFLKKIKCNLGDYEFHIDPYGKTFFCCLMEPFGNIKTDYLPEIWYSPATKTIREQIYNCRKNCHIMINCFYEDESTIDVQKDQKNEVIF